MACQACMFVGAVILLLLVAIWILARAHEAPRGRRRFATSAAPYCVQQTCVQCRSDADCPPTSECSGGACVARSCALAWPEGCQSEGDFEEYSGAWPSGYYGDPTSTGSGWATNSLADPAATTAEECAAACNSGCSGFSFDAGSSRCAVWPYPLPAGVVDGSGTPYAGDFTGYTYGLRRGPPVVGDSCNARDGVGCWSSDSAPGYELYEGAKLDITGLTPLYNSVQENSIQACAAFCDSLGGAAWNLSGSNQASTDGITANKNAGWCSVYGSAPCIALEASPTSPGCPTWYSGVKWNTPHCK